MKKLTLIAIVALLAGGAFAQDQGAPGGKTRGGDMEPRIEWTLGTVVTIEYKKVTGVVTIPAKGPATIKIDGVDYRLRIPKDALASIKSGDTVTVEGRVTTVKSDQKVQPIVDAFKLTVNGKEIVVAHPGPDRQRKN